MDRCANTEALNAHEREESRREVSQARRNRATALAMASMLTPAKSAAAQECGAEWLHEALAESDRPFAVALANLLAGDLRDADSVASCEGDDAELGRLVRKQVFGYLLSIAESRADKQLDAMDEADAVARSMRRAA